MLERRSFPLLFIFSAAVAFGGILLFIGGLLVEAFGGSIRVDRPSPAVVLALGGLCVAAFVFLLWFVVIGLMLARQTRAQGSGYGDAYRLIEQFRFRDAIPLLERSIREGHETSEVLMLLTSAYAYTGQLAKAQFTADRAVRLFPDDPESYITLANGYRLQAAHEEAARALTEAVTLAPDQPTIWAELGFSQRFAGDHDAARASFERATEHAMPAAYAVRVYFHLSRAYQQGGEAECAARAAAKMMSARDGLALWKTGLRAMEGTAYGQALRYEIAAIEQAIADADAGNLG